ncbi:MULTISPECIES: hypothetical protein [unclassified Kribbella]|uniref:hypothetical protein n=1 Tax=unclassified Kribbella TaxID=2644121 RepID=UPI0033EE97C1
MTAPVSRRVNGRTTAAGETVAYCLAVATIMRAIEHRVGEIGGVTDVRVEIDQDAQWSPDLMTAYRRDRLAAHRAADRTEHRVTDLGRL